MRSLEQLKNSSDILSGAESQRLRTFCTSEYLDVTTGLSDPAGQLLLHNRLDSLQELLRSQAGAKDELFRQRWGPTRIPVFNVILTLVYLQPRSRAERLATVRWLVHEARLGTDGIDLSGTSALMHAISMKPYLDTDFAQLMLDGGADVNRRNRYGCTTASEIAMVWPGQDEEPAARAMRWFVEHGGDVDIRDGDGISAKRTVMKQAGRLLELAAAAGLGESPSNAKPAPSTTWEGRKVARNEQCPCESGKKFKACHGKA
ncbi:MAG: hypothetical protein LQ340_001530 [Diploschistes diacapsis]|nr:MAG: hypothetical protein LQ340_001530 [Diploschistes diacapsis]